MDNKLSVKISAISFYLLLFVVVNHSVNIEYRPAGDNTVWFIENLISYKLSKVMIPTFFFISGFLFFLNIDVNEKFSFKPFKVKIAKRMKTLAIPYFFWCTVWFVFLYLVQMLPALKVFFSSPLHQMTLFEKFWNLYLEPINYPFWFIRELLLYVIVTPILFLLTKYLKLFSLLLFFILAAVSFSLFTFWKVDIYRFHMLFYYCLGIYCAVNKVSLKVSVSKLLLALMLFAFVALCAALIYIDKNYNADLWYFKLGSNLVTLLGCGAMLVLYDYLDNRYNFSYKKIFAYGFIIYATHGIPILLFKEAFVSIFKPNDWESLLFYFVSIITIVATCIGFGMIFRKISPTFYAVVTGNR